MKSFFFSSKFQAYLFLPLRPLLNLISDLRHPHRRSFIYSPSFFSRKIRLLEMMFSRIATRSSTVGLARCRDSLLALARRKQSLINASAAPALVNLYHSFAASPSKGIWKQESQLNHMHLSRFPFQHCNMSSSVSAEPNEKETVQSGNEHETDSVRVAADTETEAFEDAKISDEKIDTGSSIKSNSNASGSAEKKGGFSKWFKFSDSDSTSELSRDSLLTLVKEKEEELKNKHEEFQKMQEKALRTYAEMQNSMSRTKREAENLKKFAIQDFAKRLLDVADNLERACSVVKKDLSKIEESKDDAALQPLKTLMQGVEMTEKQLAEVFKKYGVVKYDALNEEFDPHKHNAVFQVPDPSKRPGTVAHVLKSGYMLHDRIIRPAEVGVTQAVEGRDAEQSSAH